MRIAVVGSGGVGGYFGGKLAAAGHAVTFVARGSHKQAMLERGLSVKSLKGDFVVPNVNVTDDIVSIGTVDLVIIAVKAWQVKEAAPAILKLLKPTTIVLPLQNGIMAFDELAAVVGSKHVLGGLCRIFSKIEAPGIISHFGVEPTILLGEMDGQLSERSVALSQMLNDAGITAKAVDNINVELWKKFIAICVSGLLAITRSTYGELRQLHQTRSMMVDLFNEIFTLSQAIGIGVEDGFVDKTMAFIDTFPFDTTSSMARDIWDGKPSEIDYQNGTVVVLGEKHGVATPLNRFVYDTILPMERRARGAV